MTSTAVLMRDIAKSLIAAFPDGGQRRTDHGATNFARLSAKLRRLAPLDSELLGSLRPT
jgi:hypothetical protein